MGLFNIYSLLESTSIAAEIRFAFRGRLMSLLGQGPAGSHLGLSSHRSLSVFPPLSLFFSLFLKALPC